ncbi:helix-turn-helix domain-containing protein, partial [Achromobacter xylosoxidans]
MNTLAQRLREAMDQTGIKQVDIARAANIKPPSVAGWLNGKTKNIRGANLVSVAQLLNVSEAWLADGKLPKERMLDSDWPFPRIPKDLYYQLTVSQRNGIEDWVLKQVEAYVGTPPVPSPPKPLVSPGREQALSRTRVPVEPLLQWLRKTPKQEAQARCRERGTSVGYLRQVAYGYKLAGLIAADIELITNGECRRQDLRPNDFGRLWPELAAGALGR